MILAAILMAEAVWFVTQFVGANTGTDAVLRLAVGTVVGIAVYLAALVALRAPELDAVRNRLGR
jgi:putative peptidoglycan lipid II flippase